MKTFLLANLGVLLMVGLWIKFRDVKLLFAALLILEIRFIAALFINP